MDVSISLLQPHRRGELFGPSDRHLRRIRETLGVRIRSRNATVHVSGESPNVARAAAVIERLQEMLRAQPYLADEHVEDALAEAGVVDADEPAESITVFNRQMRIAPMTDGQRHYFRALRQSDMVFCLGPAGTGKTYIAVAMAVNLLKRGVIKRMALVRPAVEAGEKLGFLPGDIQQKVNPYLRPIFDALSDMMTYEQLKRFMMSDVIEVCPLAYMRGRTLNNAVMILDEAQNTTPAQMLMFLTRMGTNSRAIVTGDDSQIDLAPGAPSGLVDAVRRLRGVRGIDIVRLMNTDIVRHPLVQEIVHRYGGVEARAGAPDRSGGDRPLAERD